MQQRGLKLCVIFSHETDRSKGFHDECSQRHDLINTYSLKRTLLPATTKGTRPRKKKIHQFLIIRRFQDYAQVTLWRYSVARVATPTISQIVAAIHSIT